jgi:Zinc dependent phospholipase C
MFLIVRQSNPNSDLNRKAPNSTLRHTCEPRFRSLHRIVIRVFHDFRAAISCILAVLLTLPAPVSAYAVLSHEAIIDAVWETHIKPLVLKKFPQATEQQLSEAQAYAYGGAIIQDLGYYPYGSPFFSDLTHYIRSGDFIQALLRDAKDIDEYAFSLGAMAHYAADNAGHRIGINRAVPVLYPRLRKKFGDSVSFEDDRLAHIKTEFGFDVLEVARERFAPDSYHDFIGFEVSRSLLEQAFKETYGLELKDVLLSEGEAFNSYRRDVSKLIPKATRIAWSLKKDEIRDDIPDMTKKKFLYNLSRSNYEHEWGKNYHKPTPAERFLAFLFKLIPKFGPLKVLEFRTPTPQTEQMFEASFNSALDRYRTLLNELREGHLDLPNDNCDVGERTGPGKYRLNDDTHAKLLDKLADSHFSSVSTQLREELLGFFADLHAPYATKRNAKAWAKVQTELEHLKSAVCVPEDVGHPAITLQAAEPSRIPLP